MMLSPVLAEPERTRGSGMEAAEEMQKVICGVNGGEACPQCLPVNLRNSALKRINMAFGRWLVRADGIWIWCVEINTEEQAFHTA